jgi:hypothetical protein
MTKTIERFVKDQIIERLQAIPEVYSLSTTARGQVVGESNLPDGKASVQLMFPGSAKTGGCGFVRVIFPVIIQAKFRFEGDVDSIDPEYVRDTLDDFEESVHSAMIADLTWGGLAFDTNWLGPRFKHTSEDLNLPEAVIALSYEVEIHHPADSPLSVK